MIPCIFLTKTISSKLFLAPSPNRESELDVSSSGIGWLRCPQCCWLQQPLDSAAPGSECCRSVPGSPARG